MMKAETAKDRNRDEVIKRVFEVSKIKELRRYRLVPMAEVPLDKQQTEP
jgi:hypothetical protein